MPILRNNFIQVQHELCVLRAVSAIKKCYLLASATAAWKFRVVKGHLKKLCSSIIVSIIFEVLFIVVRLVNFSTCIVTAAHTTIRTVSIQIVRTLGTAAATPTAVVVIIFGCFCGISVKSRMTAGLSVAGIGGGAPPHRYRSLQGIQNILYPQF